LSWGVYGQLIKKIEGWTLLLLLLPNHKLVLPSMALVNPDLMLVKQSDKASQKGHVEFSRPGNLAVNTHTEVVVFGEFASAAATFWEKPAPKVFADGHRKKGWCKDCDDEDRPVIGRIESAGVKLVVGCIGS
jgi:hypothetical protein